MDQYQQPSGGDGAAGPEGAGDPSLTADDRRRRQRRPTRWPGWISQGHDVWEVVMLDVSECGAGFLSPVKLEAGEMAHLKIGIGPSRRHRSIRVAHATPQPDGGWRVGVTYADESAPPA